MTPPAFDDVHRAFAALNPDRIKPGLERTQAALAVLGDPHRAPGITWVIIAGTNGKGSTSAFLDAVCRAAGRTTAHYTSPHLEHLTERIKLDGAAIGEADFARLGARVLEVVEGGVPLSFFEALTVTAFLWYAERRPEIGVLEVGLGGRWDATNVADPALAVLTTIGLDHTDWLGDDLVTIAREKAGVVRPGGLVVSGLPDDLHEAAVVPALGGGRAVRPGRDVHGALRRAAGAGAAGAAEAAAGVAHEATPLFTYDGLRLRVTGVPLGIGGAWQQHNATLAAAAAELLLPDLTAAQLEAGLTAARWPGRYERLAGTGPGTGAPLLLLDGAHNEQGAEALASSLATDPPQGRIILVAATRQDKDPTPILAALWPHLHAAVLTWVPGPKSRPPDALAAAAPPTPLPGGVTTAPDPAAALATARVLATPADTILVAGSLYLVGAVRTLARV